MKPASPIPDVRFDDLDVDCDEDQPVLSERLSALATTRLAAARARLERLGIIGPDGELVSTELPSDMRPDSETTLETG